MKEYYVYILANYSRTLYIGVTNNLVRRIYEHRNQLNNGFTKKYGIHRLVYYEVFQDVSTAILREKELKGWVRKRKIALIKQSNPEWKDLARDWYE
jgi:putative endonuclease